MKAAPAKMKRTEEDFAAGVVSWLEADQWEVFQEVQLDTQCHCADIVAKRGPLVMIVECKLTRSLDLIEQLIRWEGYAHYLTAAVPSGAQAFEMVLRKFGFGYISVPKDHHVYNARYGEFRRAPFGIQRMRAALTEERKTFAKAGNAYGARFTPYAETCRIVRQTVAEKPGIQLSELLRHLRGKHHYSSDSSARSSLLKWAEKGSVKGVRVERHGRSIQLFPAAIAAPAAVK